MASGSTIQVNNGDLNGFDLLSEDVLCSYEDYTHDVANGTPDLSIGLNSKDSSTRILKSSLFPSTYSSREESTLNQDMLEAMENTMKKTTDNMMRFLEGISSRLSQLELYCYNIDKSVGHVRSNFDRDHDEADSKLKSIQKHLQEVNRSVQVLRDKQELAETQQELAKLQLAQRGSSTTSSVQQDEETATPREAKKGDHWQDMNGQQLALAPSRQATPQPSLPSRPVEQSLQPPAPQMLSQNMSQAQAYYLSPPQMTTLLVANQAVKGQYMPSNSQYQASQIQDLPRLAPLQTQSQGNQTSQHQSMPTYQQQWSQQVQQLPQSVQPQMKVSSTSPYLSYLPVQQNPPQVEMAPNSAPMQAPFLGASQAHAVPQEVISYSYGGTVAVQDQAQPTLHHSKTSDGYSLSPGNTYIIYDGEGGRVHHPSLSSHFSQGGYSQVMMPVQNPSPTPGQSPIIRPLQFVSNHPYNEIIDKLANMGYRGEHVVGAIQKLEESGQPVDFNAVLDRLTGHSSTASQRGWSG